MFKFSKSLKNNEYVYYLLALCGITFWFLLAFPFENRNESYSWLPQLQSLNILQVLTVKFTAIQTFRPLSQGIAWALYHLFNHSIYPVEFLNYILLVISFILLIDISENKLILAVSCFILGGFLISIYTYIFNLQGIFYSPLILLSVILLRMSKTKLSSHRKLIFVSILSIIFTLIHTYSIVLYFFFLTGYFYSFKKSLNKFHYSLYISVAIITLLVIKFIGGDSIRYSLIWLADNFYTIAQNASLNNKLSPIYILLLLLLVPSITIQPSLKNITL